MARRPMTPEDLWRLPRVGSPEPSPDGRCAIVPVTTYSLEQNEGKTRLWLLPADAREAGAGGRDDPARALTSAEVSSSQPSWSPDASRLLFIRKPGGASPGGQATPARTPPESTDGPSHPDQPQVYLQRVDGGEPERLTDLPLGAADPRWFPDGRRIAFLAPVYAQAPDLAATSEHARKLAAEPVKARVTEDRLYRYWDQWLTDGKVHHIFVMDLETREILDLIPDSRRWFDWMDIAGQYRISPDGREIAFAACRTEPPHDPVLWGVFTVKVPAKTRSGEKLEPAVCLTPDYPADAVRPVYSPDGRWIIFGMQREYDFYADRVRLVAYDRRSRRHTVLTERWDRSCAGWTFGKDPETIYLMAEVEARAAFFALDLQSARRNPDATQPRELCRGGTFTSPKVAGERIFASLSSLTQPPEAVCVDLDGRNLRRLTAFTRPILAELALGTVEEMIFTGAEEAPVQMFLLNPPRTDGRPPAKGRKLPLVHLVHGGPHGVFGDEWHWRWNAQVIGARGYLLAMVNFHGSTGWGQEFTASILGRWGDQPYADLMAATDHLIRLGRVDPKRMAAAGGSYGGYLVSWIASQTDRFACLINHAGVCDFQTQYASDVTQGRARSMGGEPWENLDGMDRYNPMRRASGFRSPMLIIHGENDYRVPYDQGIALYNVYRAMKLPARLVCFPDENHWILKPRNSLFWYGEFLGWLERWIGGGAGASSRRSRSRAKE